MKPILSTGPMVAGTRAASGVAFGASSRCTDLQSHAAVASVTTEPEAERQAVAFTALQRTVVCWFKSEVGGDPGPWFERQR